MSDGKRYNLCIKEGGENGAKPTWTKVAKAFTNEKGSISFTLPDGKKYYLFADERPSLPRQPEEPYKPIQFGSALPDKDSDLPF